MVGSDGDWAVRFFLLILGYAAISAFGLATMKAAPRVQSVGYAAGFVCYGLGFLVWLVILQRYPLSLSFPIAAGSLVIATQVLSFFLLHETITPVHLFGVGLVIIGIGVVYANG
jgi:multidrug transporter EmrE-like cation transporter